MKTLRIFLTISTLLLSTAASACYNPPYEPKKELIYRVLPDVSSYYNYEIGVTSFSANTWNSDKQNIELWTQQTGGALAETLLDDFLYHDRVILNGDTLNATPAVKAFFDYLVMARDISQVRKTIADPWYYPSGKGKNTEFGQMTDYVEKCKSYTGPLRNRYVLQALRCMNAMRDYEEAEKYWRSVSDKLNDDVVSTMCRREAAASLYKTGHVDEAAEIYAALGDISSLRIVKKSSLIDEMEYVYEHNPDSPYFPEILQVLLTRYDGQFLEGRNLSYYGYDCKQTIEITNLCRRVLDEKRVDNPALWNYALAAILDARNCTAEALQQLEKGGNMRKDAFLADSYHVLHMYLEAKLTRLDSHYEKRLSKDLQWLSNAADTRLSKEKREELTEADAYWYADTYFWNDAMRRIVHCVLVPRYLAEGRTTRALQLANYADNRMFRALGKTDMYDKESVWNWHDYSNLMFNMADSLSGTQLEEYYKWTSGRHSSLDRVLKVGSNLDQSYWADIIGTHYIRENNYAKAVEWLAKVTKDYQQKMNVYPYLDRDPFDYNFTTAPEHRHHLDTKDNYKLNFAREMLRLQREMAHTPLGQEYAEMELRYAAGIYNQEFWCWSLTRYLDTSAYYPPFDSYYYYSYDESDSFFRKENERRQGLIYRFDTMREHALALMTDYEVKARYMQIWGWYAQVLISCPETSVASEIRLNCDEWRDYCAL